MPPDARVNAAEAVAVDPVKRSVTWNGDGTHTNESFDSATALDMRRVRTTKKLSRLSRSGVLFRGNGLHWYLDSDLERDAEVTRLLALGIPAFTPAVPDDPPDGGP